METTPSPSSEAVPSRASEWLVALNEQPGNAELRVRFDRWLAASPEHARDWAEMSRTSSVLAAASPQHEREWGAFVRQRHAARAAGSMPAAGVVPRRRRRLAVAAAFAVAACLLLFLGSGVLLRFEADYVTATAEQRAIQLADGTTVQLGPESAIALAYDDAARRVRLLKGKAYFEVASDRRRPFVVEARDVEARDIGTAFDVTLAARSTDVAVREGIVDVSAAGATSGVAERLTAGDWLRVMRAGQVERGRLSPDQVAAWTQGQLVVKNRAVADVVDALRPYFAGLVVLRGAALEAQPLTGVYNLSDPVEALRAVARAQGATLLQVSPWLIVISGD